MDKIKSVFSGDKKQENKGIVTQINDATTLSWSTRIKGFLVCFALGMGLSILGSCLLFIKHGLIIFAVLYTVGNLLALASTCFLMGPVKQVKKMFAKIRIIATILVFVMIILTLVCAFAIKGKLSGILTIICCILQFLALTWYSLSYIPYARDLVIKCFNSCLA